MDTENIIDNIITHERKYIMHNMNTVWYGTRYTDKATLKILVCQYINNKSPTKLYLCVG